MQSILEKILLAGAYLVVALILAMALTGTSFGCTVVEDKCLRLLTEAEGQYMEQADWQAKVKQWSKIYELGPRIQEPSSTEHQLGVIIRQQRELLNKAYR